MAEATSSRLEQDLSPSEPVADSPLANGVPLVVGVTGHRDLRPEQLDALGAEIDRFLGSLQEFAPHTTVTVMCGMAEGADMLVATRALKQGIDVEAVLPMPLEFYETDFASESRERLGDLLNTEGVRTIELPLPPDVSADAIRSPGPERDKLYANLADRLIARSAVLLALWDGRVSGLLGGTSDVVLRFLGASSDGNGDRDALDFADVSSGEFSERNDQVYWLPAGRNGATELESSSNSLEPQYLWLPNGDTALQHSPSMPAELTQRLRDLDDYNARWRRLDEEGKLPSSYELLPENDLSAAASESPSLESISREYGKADSLAMYYQKRSDALFKLFGLMAAAMGLLFLLFAKVAPINAFLIAYLAVFAVGIGFFTIAGRHGWLGKHLLYRVLAETARTRFFLTLAGVDRRVSVDRLMHLTGINRFAGFTLIPSVLKSSEPAIPPASRSESATAESIELTRTAWVDDQAAYFERKIKQLSRAHHRIGRVKYALVAVFVSSTFLLIFIKDQLSGTAFFEVGSEEKHEDVTAKTLLLFGMGILPFFLGVWEIYANKMATKELLWQYKNQADYFRRASDQLAATSSVETREDVIADLGEKSLVEGYLWTMHRYHREHDPPAGG